MASLIRRMVSRHKIRFQNEEFDLDLTYITDRIIAMSWPGDGAEGWYRNPIGEVARMLDKYHFGHYRVYNLCAERGYDEARFTGGSVITFPMDDHHVPPLPMLFDFIRDAQQYLDDDEANTAVVHCKAGKGRTGICVAALLLSLGRSHTWSAALAQFAISRTANGVGVTIASQRRWVQYFDIARAMDSLPPHAPLDLKSVRVCGIPARIAPRLVVVLSQREHSEAKGYWSRVLVAAGLGRGYSAEDGRCPARCDSQCTCAVGAGASSFGQLLCGAPNRSASGPPPCKLEGGGRLAITNGGGAKAPLRVQSGHGWRLALVDESTLVLEFEDEHGHCEPCSRVDGDFRVQVFVDQVSRSRSLFWAWHNTAFLSGCACTLTRDGLDKVSPLVPSCLELSMEWRVAGESLPSALAAPRGTSESALLSPVPQRSEGNGAGGDSGFADLECAAADDPLGVTCAQIPEVPLRRRTPEPPHMRAWHPDVGHPLYRRQQPPAVAGALESPRDTAADDAHRDGGAIDLSLLRLYDGQWMGAAAGEDAMRQQSMPTADATARVKLNPSWATTHLHRTSAFLKVAEERLNGGGGCGGFSRGVSRAPCTSEPILPRRSVSASAGHPTFPDHSAFATAAGGGAPHFVSEDAHPALPGIRVGAAHSHAEPEYMSGGGGVGMGPYVPSQTPISPLAGALSNPLSAGSGMFARTISQPSFPHASGGSGADCAAAAGLSPQPTAAEPSWGGLSSRSQPQHKGASSFLEYCQTSTTSVADDLSDEEDCGCALLPHLDRRSSLGQYPHVAHTTHGKIPLRLPRPPPRRQPRYKAGVPGALRGGCGVRSGAPWRCAGDAEGGYDSEGLPRCGTPPLPPSRSRRLQRSTSGRDRASSSHSGLGGVAAAQPHAAGSRRLSDHGSRRTLQASLTGGAVSDSLGRLSLTCEDPLAPWAGDPAATVAGPSVMSMEEYVGSASAFFTSDGTSFSGDLRDSISFGTVR